MTKQIPETSICISMVRKKTPKVTHLFKKWNVSGVAQSDLEKADEINGPFTNVFNRNDHSQLPLLAWSAPFYLCFQGRSS